MKKIFFLFFILITSLCFSQQAIRGYHVSYDYGYLSYADNFEINYEDSSYLATPRNAIGHNISFGFPFDFGYKRHRLTLTPGLEISMANYNLNIDPDIPVFGNNSDSLKLSSLMINPFVGAMYKLHFYVFKFHLALSIGADFKYTVSNTIIVNDHNGSQFLTYPSLDNKTNDKIIFPQNSMFSSLSNIGFQICPKFGFDIYPTKFLVTHLFVSFSPLTSYSKTPELRGYAGFGLSYLVPFKREDESKILQYYKK